MHPFLVRKIESKQENAAHIVCYLIWNALIHSTPRLIDENFRLQAKLFKHANKLNFQFIKLPAEHSDL